MLTSNPYRVTVKGQPVDLYVMRNNGECWGRIVPAAGPELDITSRVDLYDWTDEDAASMLLRRAQRGHTEPAMGWLLRPAVALVQMIAPESDPDRAQLLGVLTVGP